MLGPLKLLGVAQDEHPSEHPGCDFLSGSINLGAEIDKFFVVARRELVDRTSSNGLFQSNIWMYILGCKFLFQVMTNFYQTVHRSRVVLGLSVACG